MTTLADHLPHVSLLRRSPGSSPAGAVPGEVSSRAPTQADLSHALCLLDEYGDELLRMARVITGSHEAARTVVSEALQTAAIAADPSRGDVDRRACLVAAVFRGCRASLDAEALRAEPTNESINRIARISDQQRGAVALYLHGAQTPAQIGSLLSLTTRAVGLLLLSALDELATSDAPRRRPRAHDDAPSTTDHASKQEGPR